MPVVDRRHGRPRGWRVRGWASMAGPQASLPVARHWVAAYYSNFFKKRQIIKSRKLEIVRESGILEISVEGRGLFKKQSGGFVVSNGIDPLMIGASAAYEFQTPSINSSSPTPPSQSQLRLLGESNQQTDPVAWYPVIRPVGRLFSSFVGRGGA